MKSEKLVQYTMLGMSLVHLKLRSWVIQSGAMKGKNRQGERSATRIKKKPLFSQEPIIKNTKLKLIMKVPDNWKELSLFRLVQPFFILF